MVPIPFTKKSEALDDLANKLLLRGLVVPDRNELLHILEVVGYYRLSGYLYPFRLQDGTDNFVSGTTLDEVWECYSFDRRLRLVTFDAISRIEVAVRAMIVRHQAEESSDDPFVYLDCRFLPNLDNRQYPALLDEIDKAIRKSRNEPCVKHFTSTYGLTNLPIWAVMEIIPFGTVTYYYQGLPFQVKKKICDHFHVHPSIFLGWLMALKRVRNICAHHGRLWNRQIDARISQKIDRIPMLGDLYQCLKVQSGKNSTTMFTVLSICAFCLREIRPESKWVERLKKTVDDYPGIPLQKMGFPSNWKSYALWK